VQELVQCALCDSIVSVISVFNICKADEYPYHSALDDIARLLVLLDMIHVFRKTLVVCMNGTGCNCVWM